MFKLYFSFSHRLDDFERSRALEEMREWMTENEYRHVTQDTLIYNMTHGSPNLYFRIRESVRDGRQYVVTCSHEEILIHFKMRWSDYWV